MEDTQSVAPAPAPVNKVFHHTDFVSKELRDQLLRKHNMRQIVSQPVEQLRVMYNDVVDHIKRITREILYTSNIQDLKTKSSDVKLLKVYKRSIWQNIYSKEHPIPRRKEVFRQVVKAHLLMENLLENLHAEKTNIEAIDMDAEAKEIRVMGIAEDIEKFEKDINTIYNIDEYLYEK